MKAKKFILQHHARQKDGSYKLETYPVADAYLYPTRRVRKGRTIKAHLEIRTTFTTLQFRSQDLKRLAKTILKFTQSDGE